MIQDFIEECGDIGKAVEYAGNQLPMKSEVRDFKIEVTDGGEATLPPWNVKGVLVDIVTYVDQKILTVVVSFRGMLACREEEVANVVQFAETVVMRLKEKVPESWRVE